MSVAMFALVLFVPNLVDVFPMTPTGRVDRVETMVLGAVFWLLWFAVWRQLWHALLGAAVLFLPWWPIDIYLRTQVGTPFGRMFAGIVMETHEAELMDFLSSYAHLVVVAVLFYLLLVGLCVPAVRRAGIAWRHRSRWWILMLLPACLGLLQFSFARQEAGFDIKPPPDVFRVEPLDYMGSKLSVVYPLDMPFAMYRYWQDRRKVAELREQMRNFSFGAVKDPVVGAQVLVFVIGESSRTDRWQLGGYARATNPLLSVEPNLFFFTDVVTRSIATRTAVPGMVSREPIIGADGGTNPKVEPGFLRALQEAGYATYWLSNQGSSGYFETSTVFYARDAQHVQFFNPGDYQVEGRHDEAMLQPLRAIVADGMKGASPRVAIVLHTMGSHFNYAHRYPDRFDVFQPSLRTPGHGFELGVVKKVETNNAYDNSVLYTDYVLSRVIGILRDAQVPAAMAYMSDHGEDLYEPGCLSPGLIRLGETSYRVPTLVWLSDQLLAQQPDWRQQMRANKAVPMVADVMFGTVLDLAGVRVHESGHIHRSLVHPIEPYHEGRRVVAPDNSWTDFDKAAARSRCQITAPDGHVQARGVQ